MNKRIFNLIFASVLALACGVACAQTYNLFKPANGILKGSTSTYVTTSAASSDVISLWSGTCNSTTFMRGDGSCAAAGGGGSGTVTSVALTMPTGFSVGGSPVTTTGTLAVTSTLNGIIKGNGSSVFSAAASADVISLFTGTCNGSSFLRGDGACASAGGGLSFPILAPDGTVGAPSFSFSNATDAGLWLDTGEPAMILQAGAGNSLFLQGDIVDATATGAANLTGDGVGITATGNDVNISADEFITVTADNNIEITSNTGQIAFRSDTLAINDALAGNTAVATLNGSSICTVATGCGGGTSFGNNWDWTTSATQLQLAYPTIAGNWLNVEDDGAGNGLIEITAYADGAIGLAHSGGATLNVDANGVSSVGDTIAGNSPSYAFTGSSGSASTQDILATNGTIANSQTSVEFNNGTPINHHTSDVVQTADISEGVAKFELTGDTGGDDFYALIYGQASGGSAQARTQLQVSGAGAFAEFELSAANDGQIVGTAEGPITLTAGTQTNLVSASFGVRANLIELEDTAGGNTATVTLNGKSICLADGTDCPSALSTHFAFGRYTVGGSACTVAAASNSGVTSCTWNIAGSYTLALSPTVTTGWTCTANSAANTAARTIRVSGATNSAVNIFTYDSTLGTLVDADFTVQCMGF